jgi:DNA polymerase
MTPIYLDFESYWSTTHTLTRMSPTEYVMHPETEIISLAIKVGTGKTIVWFGEDNIRERLQAMDWSDAMAIGHNMSGFDALIMAWRFKINPKLWGCTAAMARSKYGKTCGVSLAALSKHLGLGEKLSLEATNTKGKHLIDFTPSELASMETYNVRDTELCADLFQFLARGFPRDELLQIDMTTRMLVEPSLELDYRMVRSALEQVQENKRRSLLDLARMLGIETFVGDALEHDTTIEEQVRIELASAAKFSALLIRLGVEAPMKVSPTNPEKMVPALAKTDEAFIELQEHDNPLVAAAALARLEVKSTLLETRLQKFIAAANACEGLMPVPLRYAGADTTGRWSGEQYNMQNLPRIDPKNPKPSDALRNSLRAPDGYKVVVADLSGIELRVNHFLWKVPSSMELYAADAEADLYRAFAAARYGITPAEVDKAQRQLAKVAQLGLGFGAGSETFRRVAKLMGGLDISAEESSDIVNAWRQTYAPIVSGWKAFQGSLPHILQGTEHAIDPWGLCITEKNAVRLPSGRRIYYPALRKIMDNGKSEWWYGEGRHKARIYAGKGVENLVQALARDVVANHASKVLKITGRRPAMSVHDELVYVVPENEADEHLAVVQGVMRGGVNWWPELLTWSEGDVADSYGAAK